MEHRRAAGCLRTLLVLLTLTASSQAARILLVPFPFHSHVSQAMRIGEGLADRGHEVYHLTSPTLPDLDKYKSSRIKTILYNADEPDFYTTLSEEDMSSIIVDSMDMTMMKEFRTFIDGFKEMCSNPLKDKALYEKLRALEFDMAIVDVFPNGRCMLVLMHRLNIPYINLLTITEPWLTRNPALLSASPFMYGYNPYTPKMTFWERLDNLQSFIDWSAFTGVEFLDDEYLKEYFYETTPVPLDKLAGDAQLWLIDQTPVMDYPTPTMPNEVHVGGLATKPAQPLPEDLEKFMTSNPAGVIVVSFGSWGGSVPLTMLEEMIAAFELGKYNVVLQFAQKEPKNVSSKIKLLPWLPQNDLLGHENTRLFITHCGASGQFEGLYHGVPMIGFPMFGDQPFNARRSEYHGFGHYLDLRTVTAKDLADMIVKVIENPKYTENIRAASAIFRDQPMTPRETALYWIEHVIKHGGRHLRSHALDMVWYEYLMLDIVVFVLGVFTVFVVVSCCIVKKVLSMVCGTKQKAKAD